MPHKAVFSVRGTLIRSESCPCPDEVGLHVAVPTNEPDRLGSDRIIIRVPLNAAYSAHIVSRLTPVLTNYNCCAGKLF
jgi:hypothetical protein